MRGLLFSGRNILKIPLLTNYIAQKAEQQTRAILSGYFPSFMRQLSWGLAKSTLSSADIFANWSGICIDIVAKHVAKIPNSVYVKGEINEDPAFWLNGFLTNPTHRDYNLTWIEIKELLFKWLLSYGNAYLYVPSYDTRNKYPIQCWVLPATAVNIIPSTTNARMIDHYVYYSDSGMKVLNTEEILHLKTISPSATYSENFLTGTPYQLNAAKQAVLSEKERKLFEQKYYEREGVRPIFIKDKNEMTEDQWQNFQARLNETMPANYQVVGVLENDRSFEALDVGMSGSASGSNLTTDNKENQKIIARSFGIPFGILDTESQQNRATAETNEANFRTGTVEYWVTWFESAFNKFIQRYDPACSVKHESFIWDNPDDIIKRQTFELSYGIKTINDIRIESGYEEVDGGDVPLIPGSFQSLNAITASVGLPSETPTKDNNSKTQNSTVPYVTSSLYHHEKQPDEMSKMILWKVLDKQRSRHEKIIESKAAEFYSALRDEYLNAVRVTKSRTKKIGDLNIDIDKWIAAISDKLGPSASDSLRQSMQRAIDDYDPTAQLSDFEKEYAKAMKTALEDPQMSLNTIVDEMKDKLNKVRQDNPNATEAELNELLKDEIKGSFDGRGANVGYIKAKSKMTAVMVSGFTSNVGMDVVIKRVGLEKVWLSRRDGRVRPAHRSMDGQKAADDVFTASDGSKGAFPCAMSFSTAMRARCRCYMFAQKSTGPKKPVQNVKPVQEFKPAKSIREAQKFADENLTVKIEYLPRVNIDLANKVNKFLYENQSKFKEELNFKIDFMNRSSDRSYASYDKKANRMSFNKIYNNLENRLSSDNNEWRTKNRTETPWMVAENFEDIFTHEIGHYLDAKAGWSYAKAIKALPLEEKRNILKISAYGNTDINASREPGVYCRETFAEAFTSYFRNKKELKYVPDSIKKLIKGTLK